MSLIAIFILFAPMSAAAFPLRPSLAKLSRQDSVCRVWVIFTDKNGSPRTPSLSPRALERRRRAGAVGFGNADIAVSSRYLAGLTKLGCRLEQIFKWANAASVTVHASRLSALAECSYVKDVVGVRASRRNVPVPGGIGLAKQGTYDSSGFYGVSYSQLAMMQIPAVHRYVSSALSEAPGTGVVIGLFDTGFRTKHACLSHFISGNHLLADSDFIDHDNTVADPDSVVNNPASTYYHNDEHGSMTLSLIAGYDPPLFTGGAWGARFILARTEDSPVERHYEEDSWAAAMVWAESLGVDIVSSSLGYRDGFTPPDTDYTYRDMDGRTTIISKAAGQAVRFGVVVVNAMGNEGPQPGSINAPADVDSVISVGAVDANLNIADFSSRGPTSDGRLKPDCVALGVNDAVPSIYGTDSISYWYGSGTSFATPLVAGLCALIKQTHPNDAPAATRNRLFSSCVFLPGQTARDNTFGRGLPNAKLSCLPYNIIVTLVDSLGHAVKGSVFFRTATGAAGAFTGVATDSQGTARLTDLTAASVELYTEAPGYFGSARQNVLPQDTGSFFLIVTLAPRPVSRFVIFPNVLDIGKKHQQLTLEFTASPDDPRHYSQFFSAAVRSIDGALVWTTSQYLTENTPLVLTWPVSGKAVAPGVYYFIVNYAGKTYRQKFLITG
jgi:subtilisin family serine protease